VTISNLLFFFKKYNSFCKGGIKKAESLSLLGYSYVLDPSYRSHTIFSDAISYLPEDNQDITCIIIKAFALQYWALMLHRQAKHEKSREIDSAALVCIKTAIDLIEKTLDTSPSLKILLAEEIHINAVIMTRMGEVHSNEFYFEEADRLFRKSIRLINEFCEKAKSPHFLSAITKQSYAILLLNLNQHDAAIIQLNDSLQEQYSMSQHQIDVAKSLHYQADVYTKIKEYSLAFDCCLNALILKMKNRYANDETVKITQNLLLVVLYHGSVDIQLAFNWRNKIYRAMTAKNQYFYYKCEDFLLLMEGEINEYRDQISLKQGKPNMMFTAIHQHNEKRDSDLKVTGLMAYHSP